jgi:PAS domain S-box-containing protein
MQTKLLPSAKSAELQDFGAQSGKGPMMRELYLRAKAQLRKQRKHGRSKTEDSVSTADNGRLLHELQVHQIELEMQNAELQEARGKLEALLEKYTDLYDFAPVGYMSLDEQGRILEVNLTGAALLGLGRSQIINRRLSAFVAPANRPGFLAFLAQTFARAGKHMCEATLLRQGGPSFWANIHGAAAISASGPQKWCRVVVSDITALMRSEEAQRRLEALAVANRELRLEIVRRQAIEESLKKSEQHKSRLLEQSRIMHTQLQHLSCQVLQTQEEERKRISRELHDIVAQNLTGINVQLAALAKQSALNPKEFNRNMAHTQRLVEKSVDVVHQFARELRPAVLDDLGLIPALYTFMKDFAARTGVRTHLTAFAGVEKLDIVRRTVLFRVAQEALTNVARHAQASRAAVSIYKLPDSIGMEIKDDGKAFQVQRMMQAKTSKRLGLIGMRERLEMVGGAIDLQSAPGVGTTIQVQIPFDDAGT